jgi:hypothetical protein
MSSQKEDLDLDTTGRGGTWASRTSGKVGWRVTHGGSRAVRPVEGRVCGEGGRGDGRSSFKLSKQMEGNKNKKKGERRWHRRREGEEREQGRSGSRHH